MMPHARARCQPIPATRRQMNDADAPAETAVLGFSLVRSEAEQWVSRTRSRRIRRRGEWLRAVTCMVAGGFRKGANATTILVAEDIADRMPRSKDGTVAYCLAGMVQRLRLSKRCIAMHVQILRELGLLAWAEQGSSQRNALRTRLGDAFGPGVGFKRTATIYAPVAPPAWDEAMGHRIEGEGYGARLQGVTDAGRERAIGDARDRHEDRARGSSQSPVDNAGSCTPSVVVPQPRTSRSVDGGFKDRPRRRAARSQTSLTHRAKGSTGWTPRQAAYAMAQSEFVALHTWWAQSSCRRQLAFALRPFFAAGWSGEEVARELARWSVPLRPRHVASYVRSEIRRRVNSGALFLPDGSVAPYRQAASDDGRYQGWLARRRSEAEERWSQTASLRETARAAVPQGVRRARRVPRGLADARPDRVLCTSDELRAAMEKAPRFRSGEELWAEIEELSEVRRAHAGATWEFHPPAAAEPR
ncbi:hypothetical protein [Streptomyces tirandamycinicus]|uniref:Uncharacterized protein n=1 Tax=Streptomyces tirandamycinicus TaxID=2174846 RepID=A0A2S1T217_9ACTN|nr:hypothetical protein [Streptomyces tirandamycinicus]AWI32661.1 hypothetical protein DDW44_30555 [Streptomyces tirandamycinicus]